MPRNKYPEETREKIIETSLKLFVQKGYDQTTVLDIVANLGGLTRGAFYHHFKSKEEVLEAIYAGNEMGWDVFEKARNTKGANGLQKLRIALTESLKTNTATEHNKEITMLYVQLIMSPRFLEEKVKGDIETARLMEPFIAEGMIDGSIPSGYPPRLLAELFMLMVNFWMMPTIYPATPEEMWQKGEMMEKVLEALNFPLLDDKLEEVYTNLMQTVFMPEFGDMNKTEE